MLGAAAEFWRNFRGLNEPREPKITFGSSATSGAVSGGDGDSGEPNAKKPKTDGWIFYAHFLSHTDAYTDFRLILTIFN